MKALSNSDRSIFKRKVALLASCFSLLIGIGLISLPVKAATTDSSGGISALAVSPPTFDLSANPGDSLNESIRVLNTTSSPLTISASLENFVPLGTEGQVDVTNQTNQYSLISWISVSPESATISGYGTQTFNFTINVPQNAEPSGKFGSIVFSTTPSKISSSSIVSVSQRVGDLILLRIAGQANERAFIKTFSATTGGKLPDNALSFKALVSNVGNVQVKPIGYITIRNMFGHQVASIPFPSEYILPGAERSFTTLWKHGILFGQYHANITALYGIGNKILTASTSFIVIPWTLIAIILAIAIAIGSVIWLGRYRIARAARILFGKE